MHSITPHLVCAGASDAIAFYKQAFNAVELSRVANKSGKIMNAMIRIGDSQLMLVDEFVEWGDCQVSKFPLHFITLRCLGLTMTFSSLYMVLRIGAAVAIVATGSTSSVIAQTSDKLCRTEVSAEIAKSKLHWEGFNDFGNSNFSYSESGYRMDGQGASCRIRSVRSDNTPGERVCTWNARLDCDLLLGQDATSHKFSSGNVSQYGKVKWASNEKLDVKVKRGDVTTTESREVAVVKFDGRWSRGQDSGRSISTAYFDRTWGVLLKIEGAHDFNKFGEVVSTVEFP